MNRHGVITLIGAGFLGACAGAPVAPAALAQPLRVTNGDRPFADDEGAAARTLAERECSARGRRLQTSIYDRYEAGDWIFVEGCA